MAKKLNEEEKKVEQETNVEQETKVEQETQVKNETKEQEKTEKEVKQPSKEELEIQRLSKLTLNQELEIYQLKAEIKKNMEQFQEKAKTFQKDAQEKINSFKEELAAKAESEKDHNKKFAIQKLIDQITNPLLNIEVAINSGKTQGPEVQAYVMGFEMLLNMLYQSLSDFGVSSILPNVGDEFNPHDHEILAQVDGPKDKITQCVKRGIKLYDRVVKPAVVKVGKG